MCWYPILCRSSSTIPAFKDICPLLLLLLFVLFLLFGIIRSRVDMLRCTFVRWLFCCFFVSRFCLFFQFYFTLNFMQLLLLWFVFVTFCLFLFFYFIIVVVIEWRGNAIVVVVFSLFERKQIVLRVCVRLSSCFSYRILLSLYGRRFCFLLLVRHCVFCFNLSWLKTRSSDTRLALSAASLPLPSYYYNIYTYIYILLVLL